MLAFFYFRNICAGLPAERRIFKYSIFNDFFSYGKGFEGRGLFYYENLYPFCKNHSTGTQIASILRKDCRFLDFTNYGVDLKREKPTPGEISTVLICAFAGGIKSS